MWRGSPGCSVVKNLPAYARDTKHRFDPWVRKIPWRRKATPVFLLDEFCGQKNLVGYIVHGIT